MTSKRKLEQRLNGLKYDVTRSFENVKNDVDKMIERDTAKGIRIAELNKELRSLVTEIANNGVIRDLRSHDKQIAELFDRFEKLGTNGVATSINKLNDEVFKNKKDAEKGMSILNRMLLGYIDGDAPQEPTLAGKVEAILEFLQLDLTVQPEKKTASKVVAKKLTTKKKGRK